MTASGQTELPPIPVHDTGPGFAMATFLAEERRAHVLMDAAIEGVPAFVLSTLDKVSRRWLAKHRNAHLEEIDAIAARLHRPGGYFLAVNYEWGCTVGVGPSPDGAGARLVRTLDWKLGGLGRNIVAARVKGTAGPFAVLTWPGYTGVLQGMAPGRFSASINQAPMRRLGGGLLASDWLINRVRVWYRPHQMPVHLLRKVFETARDYREAKAMLVEEPIASPVTFSLAGVAPHEAAVIERLEETACVIEGPAAATNHWRGLDHGARPRGTDSEGRLAAMQCAGPVELDPAFPWLKPPVLNPQTRLAMIADARLGRILAQGIEADGPATAVLDLECQPDTVGSA